MPALELSSVLARRDVVWRDVAGELVILEADGSRILGLNGTGGVVWQLLDGNRSLMEIAAELAANHQVSEERAQGDVLAFAQVLLDRGLARVSGDA